MNFNKKFTPKSLFIFLIGSSIFLNFMPRGISSESSIPPTPFGFKVTSNGTPYNFSLNNKKSAVFCLYGYIPGTISSLFNNIKHKVDIESPDSFVIVRELVLESDVCQPTVLTFNQYRKILLLQEMKNSWQEHVVRQFDLNNKSKKGSGGINLDIPVKIRSEAFQKIFGGSTVGLNVTGDIRIQAGFRREDRSEVRTAITRGANTNFKMQQIQRFSVTGKIGDKVTVNVDQDSERAFDFDNNVRLHYQGYEDEIIQRIEAGNISLSLPGTRYVTFSGKNSGLFGIKSQMVLGNLNVTTIASQEKGESQKLTLKGGAAEGSQKIPDYRYLKNTYFFLDTKYRDQYRYFDSDGNHISHFLASPILKDSIEVFVAGPNYESKFGNQSIRGWAVLNPTPINPDTGIVKAGEVEAGFFIRLEKSQYYVENELGYIRMNTPVANDEIIAVAYKTANETVGILNSNTLVLKLIKSRNQIPSHKTWNLAWKHVYLFGSRNIDPEGFEVKILYNPPSGPDQETDNQGRRWLEVFGLDKKDQNGNLGADGVIDMDNNIINLARGELYFPDLMPFNPVGIVKDNIEQDILLPNELRTKVIYDTTDQSAINAQSKFYIEVKTKNRSANYNLGFNVIEGSEVVILDGEELKKGVDYNIDYFSGTLTLLEERALSPSANLEITYERNQLFQLEKKTILGSRAEYNLGGNSFLGGTILYLNETTLDRKVRVGRGPMRNMVWDINTRLNFKPNFIGNVLDALPFIRAKGETFLNFEGEMAQVLPTPNTLNNRNTGDSRGVAYIDDFEGSKKTVSLGIIRKNWTRASAPKDSIHSYRNMVNYIWYNPFGQVAVQEIYPEREVNPNVPNRVHVLTFRLYPEDKDSWGGIMRALSPGFFDQTQSKFIEIMVRGNQGRLNIDLGLISEDVIPDDQLNTEDKKVNGIRDGILDAEEDVGLDGFAKPDPPVLNFPRNNFEGNKIEDVPYDFWDIDGDSTKGANEPWSYDDWFYTESDPFTYIQESGSIVGTEKNQNDEGGRIPDTEDINRNGSVDFTNSYFHYSFSLDKNHPDASLIAGGNPDRGWFLYRIPIEDTTSTEGTPSLTQIEFVRIWVDSVTTVTPGDPIEISIAEINLVGNDWKVLGTTRNDLELPTAFNDTTVAITVVNTHDNPDYGRTLQKIGVEGEEDRITGVRAREQSLVLKAANLESGVSGIVQKSLFQGENYIRYDRIKMFVHGDTNSTLIGDKTSDIEFFFRFGADKNNYYEYRGRVYKSWNEKNHINVLLQEFTTIKDKVKPDSITGVYTYQLPEDTTKSLRVKGSPSLTNVKTLILGISNLNPNGEAFTGAIWFNELRLSDVQQDKGIAMRFKANMKIADFANINGEIERTTADFHNVATRFGTGNNRLSGILNANINLDKILPQSWGVSMPLSLNFRQSSSTPKYLPGRDREVTNDITKVDSILKTIRTLNRQNGFNISFRRQSRSKNFLIKNTIDRISFNMGRSQSHAENPTINFSDTRTWSGNINYSIDFGRNNYISLLGWLPNLPLISKLKGTKFYYTPQNIAFKVNGTKNDQRSQNRLQNSNPNEVPISKTETFNLDRSVRSSMKVFENLTVDFNRLHTADMKDSDFSDFFKGKYQDIRITQSFSAKYTPRLFNWLNNNFGYSTNYSFNNNIQQRTTGRSARINTNKSAQFTLRLQQFAKSLFGSGKQSRDNRGRRPRPGERSRPEGLKPDSDNKNLLIFQEKNKEGKSLNPFKAIGNFLSKFKDITFNYSERKNITHLGLEEGKKPSLAFQFGFSDTTNVATVENLSTNNITFSNNTTYSLNSGIAFGRSFDVGLRFQHSDQRNESTAISGSSSESWLKMGKFDMPFPEWTVRITGLEKLPLFSKLFNNVSFSHNFSGQRDITWSGTSENKTQENISTNFRPLGKIDLNFKNAFTGNIQINRSRTLSRSLAGGIGARRSTNTDITITANYSKQTGFRLPIWPFNKATLNNRIDFTFSFTANTVVTEQRIGQDDGASQFDEQDRTERWSFRPSLTYSFSNQVRGGAFLEIGRNKSKRLGTTSIQEFGLDINIAIRGR
ncbi:MAG: cell surface protein SprA [bacterium]